MTLHLYLQIVGKVRMALMPRRNHWWNITLYLSSTGLTTGAMPWDEGRESLTIDVDLVEHRVILTTSRGERRYIALGEGLSVAAFFEKLFGELASLGVAVRIVPKPFDLPVTRPFPDITEYASYQAEYVTRFWRILLWVDGVFTEFAGRFYGKTCPVHLYWHHMDLAVTRFSGRKGPALDPAARTSDKDAYTHEVISFGFWAGDETVPAPAFYAYAYPSPEGLDAETIRPDAARWVDNNGSPMATLMYDDIRQMDNPRSALLAFLESTYQAGARLAGWDVPALTVPPLADL